MLEEPLVHVKCRTILLAIAELHRGVHQHQVWPLNVDREPQSFYFIGLLKDSTIQIPSLHGAFRRSAP